jgi:hypothetical protein
MASTFLDPIFIAPLGCKDCLSAPCGVVVEDRDEVGVCLPRLVHQLI